MRPDHAGHDRVIDQFLTWLDDGPVPPTALRDNIATAAMVFAAVEASRTGQPVDVRTMVGAALPTGVAEAAPA